MKRQIILLSICTVLLQGCGTTSGDRAVSGAGIGAGAGAIIGAVTGLSVLEAAAIGAATGAVTGAVTDESQINLGKPAWKQSSLERPPVTSNTVAEIQSGLARLGYSPGPVDGVMGERTREAIRAYQRDKGLLVDGRPTPELAAHLNSGKS